MIYKSRLTELLVCDQSLSVGLCICRTSVHVSTYSG